MRRCSRARTGAEEGMGIKLLFSSSVQTGGEQKTVLGKRAGAEQAVITRQEGKWGRALTLGLTSVSGLL